MIKSIYFMFFVCACLFGLFACSAKAQDKFKNLSSDDFEKLIQDEDIQRVDVRTVAEYSQGHIPGSLNINVLDEKFAAEADELLDKERPVAVYCKSGRRSRNAARILTKKDLRFTTWIKDSKTGRNLVKTSNSKNTHADIYVEILKFPQNVRMFFMIKIELFQRLKHTFQYNSSRNFAIGCFRNNQRSRCFYHIICHNHVTTNR